MKKILKSTQRDEFKSFIAWVNSKFNDDAKYIADMMAKSSENDKLLLYNIEALRMDDDNKAISDNDLFNLVIREVDLSADNFFSTSKLMNDFREDNKEEKTDKHNNTKKNNQKNTKRKIGNGSVIQDLVEKNDPSQRQEARNEEAEAVNNPVEKDEEGDEIVDVPETDIEEHHDEDKKKSKKKKDDDDDVKNLREFEKSVEDVQHVEAEIVPEDGKEEPKNDNTAEENKNGKIDENSKEFKDLVKLCLSEIKSIEDTPLEADIKSLKDFWRA